MPDQPGLELLESRLLCAADGPAVAPVLAGDVLTIDATAAADRVRVDTRGHWLRVSVNGTMTWHDRGDVGRIDILGGGGDDRLVVFLGDTTDTADLRSRGVSRIDAGDTAVTFTGIRGATVAGQADDTVRFVGSGGADTLLINANGDRATFRSPGAAFTAHGFGVIGAAGRGGADGARLIGGDGRDFFQSDGRHVSMRTDAGRWRLRQFETVTAEGGGGDDAASVVGSRGDDHAHLGADLVARLSGPGYTRTISGFERTVFSGWKSGHDTATIEDSPADDVLTYLGGSLSLAREGHHSHLGGFAHVTATSMRGGNDRVGGIARGIQIELEGAWQG